MYLEVPKEYDFDTVFPTWIIAYSPDMLAWFVTNQRFFYYEYDKEFNSEEEGVKFFKNNLKTFYDLENEIVKHRPNFAKNYIFLSIEKKVEKIEIKKENI